MSKEKSPAFQFYAAEYLADENVQIMSMEEEGCYCRLMAYCWREGSIPTDRELLSRLCKGVEPSGLVLSCFKNGSIEGRFVHQRLEIEREKQAEWRQKSAEGGRRSAHKRKHPKRMSAQQGGSTTVPRVVQPKGNSSSSVFSLQSSSSEERERRKGAPLRSHRCPPDFVPDLEWARGKRPDLDAAMEAEKFKDHEFKDLRSDWDAAWRNWIRGAKGGSANSKTPQVSAFDQVRKELEHGESKAAGLASATRGGVRS